MLPIKKRKRRSQKGIERAEDILCKGGKVEALDGWCAGIGRIQGVEQVLGWHAGHVGWSVCSKGLGGDGVALAAALDLVRNYAGGDDEEDGTQGAAECY